MKDGEIQSMIQQVASDLEIQDCLDKKIGSGANKVISGGQRRRVNVAMELMSGPSLLFLDEPTSGLSSEDAENVIRLLKRFAENGGTVVVTIHQPSADIFKMFDSVVVLGKEAPNPGRLVYYGPTHPDSLRFFNEPACRRLSRLGQDPGPELLLKGLEGAQRPDRKRSVEEWAATFQRSRYYSEYVVERRQQAASQENDAVSRRPQKIRRVANLSRIWPLLRRTVTIKLRDGQEPLIMIGQAVIAAALLILVFGGVSDLPSPSSSPEQWTRFTGDIASLHFLMTVAAVWFGCNNSARDIVGEWTVYLRERMTSLTIPAYLSSKFLVLSVFCLIQCLMMQSLVYAFCQLEGPFFANLTVLLSGSIVGLGIGLCISATARSTASAIAALPIVILPMIVLGGGIRPLPENGMVKYLAFAAPTRWAFEANLLSEADVRQERYDGSICQPLEQRLTRTQKELASCRAELLSPQPQTEAPIEPALAGAPEDIAERSFPWRDARVGRRASLAWGVWPLFGS